MGLRLIIAAAAVAKLVLDNVKKNRQTPTDSPEKFSGKDGSKAGTVGADKEKNPMPDSRTSVPVKGKIVRIHPLPPDRSIPGNFTVYEGEDMTNRQAHEAGFEFEGYNRYQGVDSLLRREDICRILGWDVPAACWRQYAWKGVPGCVITGWQGRSDILRIPRSINGRPVLRIGDGAFRGRESIRELYLPDTVMDIGSEAFRSCTGLTYARLSQNLARISERAFYGCRGLETIYTGGVRDIGESAFSCCFSLTQIRLPDRMDRIGDDAFSCSGIVRFYIGSVEHAGSKVFACTPYWRRQEYIILGDTLQRCAFRGDCGLIIDDPDLRRIDKSAFADARAGKVILSDKIVSIGSAAFYRADIKEIHAPGASRFGNRCFNAKQKITVSGDVEWVTPTMAAKGYLSIQHDSFEGTHMEEHFLCESCARRLIVVTVRNILARIELCRPGFSAPAADGLLTFEDGGDTLVMGSKIEYSVCHIPSFGAKKLKVNGMLMSWQSVQEFTELEFHKINIGVREKSYYRPKKSVTLRFKFTDSIGRKTDSAVLLYVPQFPVGSREADSLYELYKGCLRSTFDFELYDREILSRISSWHGKFTAARMRLEGGFYLTPEARERYLQLFKTHRKKAEFIAVKHGDAALLNFLENLANYEDPHKKSN